MSKKMEELKLPGTETCILVIGRKDIKKNSAIYQMELDFGNLKDK